MFALQERLSRAGFQRGFVDSGLVDVQKSGYKGAMTQLDSLKPSPER